VRTYKYGKRGNGKTCSECGTWVFNHNALKHFSSGNCKAHQARDLMAQQGVDALVSKRYASVFEQCGVSYQECIEPVGQYKTRLAIRARKEYVFMTQYWKGAALKRLLKAFTHDELVRQQGQVIWNVCQDSFREYCQTLVNERDKSKLLSSSELYDRTKNMRDLFVEHLQAMRIDIIEDSQARHNSETDKGTYIIVHTETYFALLKAIRAVSREIDKRTKTSDFIKETVG